MADKPFLPMTDAHFFGFDRIKIEASCSSTAAALSRAYEGPRFQTQASSDCLRGLRGPRRHRSGRIARNRVQ